MAAYCKFHRFMRQKCGNSAAEFIATAAMLILIFAVLISALIYVTEFYSATYICRRVVRTIEVNGEYDETYIRSLANDLGGTALENMRIDVSAHYFSGRKIQLRDEFVVQLRAVHPVNILMFGGNPISIRLPINVRLSGRSEVFWK